MNNEAEFNLKEFQKNVLTHYKSLKRQVKMRSTISEQGFAGFKDEPNTGVIKKQTNKFFRFLQNTLNGLYFKSPYFLNTEKEALEIVNNPEIKKILCEPLKKRTKLKLISDELEIETLKIVTVYLTRKEIDQRFSIKKSGHLFSMIMYKILQDGVDAYCND